MSIRKLLDDFHDVVREPGGKVRLWGDPMLGASLLPYIDLGDQIAPALHYVNWQVAAPPDLPAELAGPIAAAQSIVDRWKAGRCDPFGQTNDLLLVLRPGAERGTGLVVFLSPQLLGACLTTDFPEIRLTPALLRLLVAVLAGVPLKEGSRGDTRSAETRKTQARDHRYRFGLKTTEEVARVAGTFILRRVEVAVDRRIRSDSGKFHAHIRRFYPDGVQPLVITDRDDRLYRILAMGPVTGRPLIMTKPGC